MSGRSRKMAGTFSRLLYHFVFSTRRRALFIDPDFRDRLYPYLDGIIRYQGGWLLALGGMPDHIHLLVRLKTDVSVADTLRVLKANSSKWVHEQPDLPSQ
ncbi:MAG TPA: transposase, partial [Thermoanaerobaculia bacterium]